MKTKFGLSLFLGMVVCSASALAADTAKKQLQRAPTQSGNVTFDGARGSTTTTGGNSSTVVAPSTGTARTQEQAIQDYRNSSNTTDAQRQAIERYKNSGKSRSGN